MAKIHELTYAARLDRKMMIPVALFGQNLRISLDQILAEAWDPEPQLIFQCDSDSFLAFGETKHVECRVRLYNQDVTDEVAEWRIVRDSGSEVEDSAWALRPKARDFAGVIDIAFTAEDNDLGYSDKAMFTVTARLGPDEVSAVLEI